MYYFTSCSFQYSQMFIERKHFRGNLTIPSPKTRLPYRTPPPGSNSSPPATKHNISVLPFVARFPFFPLRSDTITQVQPKHDLSIRVSQKPTSCASVILTYLITLFSNISASKQPHVPQGRVGHVGMRLRGNHTGSELGIKRR